MQTFEALAVFRESKTSYGFLAILSITARIPQKSWISSGRAQSMWFAGDHDQFLGHDDDPRCAGRFRELATRVEIHPCETHKTATTFPARTALQMQLQLGHTRFWLCHAMPVRSVNDRAAGSRRKERVRPPRQLKFFSWAIARAVNEKVGDCLLVNPGSLGQPKNQHFGVFAGLGRREGSVCDSTGL